MAITGLDQSYSLRKKFKMNPSRIYVFTDGGCRPTPKGDALATEAIVGERRLRRVLGPRVNNFK